MNQFKVVEKFVSINGEGRRAGELACFIRLAGCNLHCTYCDTAWANEPDVECELLTSDEIYDYVISTRVPNVTITGGEPLACKNISELLEKLSSNKALRIDVETNGSIAVTKFGSIGENITFTIDYKLLGSGMSSNMRIENFETARRKDTIKFVVSNMADMIQTKNIIEMYGLDDNSAAVYVSACYGQFETKDIVKFMKEQNMNNIKVQLQMHKYIWEPDRRGV
ncbi:MAG: putative 7-carboxy-7-deazaguanine synthase QueE [Clostridium sp.]|nr:putative 7-carboxy-7-deazaguanine synthase QueE [Clostridium sp.]MCM1400030.1 putative 7-carboxy-7-deazaguanine synthase QueE [Clostridium sp.]MCM1459802.1 putative 7-carboxy-7-deazaguanine synthase QueE [Bacteroides sp.]